MPNRSIIDQLPADDRDWLEGQALERRFGGYVDLANALNEKLKEKGLTLQVSKSSVHRWGQAFEERIQKMRIAREMAKTISRELEDDAGLMNDAVIMAAQERLLSAVMEENLEPKVLTAITHAAADIARASVAAKKHKINVQEKARKVADSVALKVKKAGLSAETADQIRRDILGVADD